jgi:hypothetical protein
VFELALEVGLVGQEVQAALAAVGLAILQGRAIRDTAAEYSVPG